jgi:hypothetical protein
MTDIEKILILAQTASMALGVTERSLAVQAFNDAIKFERLKEGKDIGVRRAQKAIQWFSDNWPDDTEWPASIERPVQSLAPPQEPQITQPHSAVGSSLRHCA